ncbi:sensor histidine kinase [Paenibacillus sacheonensis]|uniref:histidine kinase n=1 Tax=Paenibacillus sacheonensis TaxID=742054 RepID=A0A7X4YU84_9BACL|nr:sensor histidine kinase [Paenibacillus sacheonensis]MBM7568989.1 sensor histidine kinase YesM [Paenibacillus sacheonensis]NBC72640.1 HAMP domain-containing protein [Paenibacillus sacheonensis]
MLRRFGPTPRRIVILSAALTLITQLALAYIGLTYMNTIDKSLHEKRSQDILYQFQQNVLVQLNDIDNLMLLLQTPEFSDYYKNLMRLRDEDVAALGMRQLQEKFNTLALSTESVQAVYFLSKNSVQRSLVQKIQSASFTDLPLLDQDRLHYSRLDKLILPDREQLTKYSKADFAKYFKTDNPMLEKADIKQLKAFMAEIQDRLVFSNGNENGVLTMIVLSDRFFQQAIPDKSPDGTYYSVIGKDNRLLWTTAPSNPLKLTEQNDSPGDKERKPSASYNNAIKELLPFKLSIVYTDKAAGASMLRDERIYQMAVLSLLTLLFTVLFSYFYLKQVFKPFRMISKQIKNFTLSSEWLLNSLPEGLIKKGFHAVSMRNKIILVLILAVGIPAVADGILYSWISKHDIQREVKASVDVTGSFSEVSIRNRLQFTETILKEISASRQLQDYVTNNYTTPLLMGGLTTNLLMFPGLNDISYFVLLDENGNCIYSSIFSNNKSAFNTDKAFLTDRSEPYWITNYNNVFNPLSMALVKRLDGPGINGEATFLLMVPKQSIFENIDSGLINTSYVISDAKGHPIYESRLRTISEAPGQHYFASSIPNTDWKLTIGFVFNDVLEKNREYQEQFLLFTSIVLLLSVVVAVAIAIQLVKPIHRLKETMLRVGEGDLSLRLDDFDHTEIGGIVRSYNRMIDQLDRVMREENELIAMKTRAELDMLQAQINPHFLYNTLEVINMRSMKSGNLEVSAIVGALADLFRYSIAKGSDIVELEKELAHVANYVTIQQIRFGHSFEVNYEVPDELRGKPIVRFVLQPIIENAIKHGFQGWEEGGLIVVSASEENGYLKVRIADNGIGMDRETLEHLRTDLQREYGKEQSDENGIGLRNVYQRLRLIYKEQMAMTIESSEMRGTTITLTVPSQSP